MKYFYRFILICCILIISSCVPKSIKGIIGNKYTYLFDGKITGLDTMLNLNGYYHTINGGSIGNTYFLFYNDGTYADLIHVINTKQNKSDSIRIINGWGHYIIHNDTIKAQVIEVYGGIIDSGYTKYIADVVDRWFKIISKDTIQEIYWYNYSRSKKDQNWDYINSFATFHPLKDKPDSNCWLKTKPWAWKDGIIIK
jgi:hypothetical protein